MFEVGGLRFEVRPERKVFTSLKNLEPPTSNFKKATFAQTRIIH
jgi:hypothetical protein